MLPPGLRDVYYLPSHAGIYNSGVDNLMNGYFHPTPW